MSLKNICKIKCLWYYNLLEKPYANVLVSDINAYLKLISVYIAKKPNRKLCLLVRDLY